jgi:hypothetical protein
MPRKTKKPPTVAEVHALWSALSTADKAEFRRLIDKRNTYWAAIDALMPHYALLYDLYRERLSLPPTTFFKWLGALCGQNGKLLFGSSRDAAWRRLYRKFKTGDYKKLERPAYFDDPNLKLVPRQPRKPITIAGRCAIRRTSDMRHPSVKKVRGRRSGLF